MLYIIEQGPSELKILESCARERRPLPEAIQNAPELDVGLEFYYNAFISLERQSSEWTAVHLYCQSYDITGEQREDFFYILRELDHFYLATMRNRPKSDG